MLARGVSPNIRGAMLLLLGACTFTIETTILKLVAADATIGQIVVVRILAQLVVAGLLLSRAGGLAALRTSRPLLQLGRGLLSLFSWWLYYLSFRTLDLALATVLSFTSQLFVVALATPIAKERLTPARIVCTLLGFAGIVVAVHPGEGHLEPGVIAGLVGATAGAMITFTNRSLTRTESTATIMAWIGIVALMVMPFVLILDWQPIAPSTLLLLVCISTLGATGMWLNIEAYRVGEVSALAPVPYSRLVLATLTGWLLFDELPDRATSLGMAVIVVSLLALLWSERARGPATGPGSRPPPSVGPRAPPGSP